MNNKVLLGTGNYIQYPVVNPNGKEYEKEYMHIYTYMCVHIHYICLCIPIYVYNMFVPISDSLCCTTETITTV